MNHKRNSSGILVTGRMVIGSGSPRVVLNCAETFGSFGYEDKEIDKEYNVDEV